MLRRFTDQAFGRNSQAGVQSPDHGQGWITTMNMDMMLYAVDLTPELEVLATRVRDIIYEIVEAGVTGDF